MVTSTVAADAEVFSIRGSIRFVAWYANINYFQITIIRQKKDV